MRPAKEGASAKAPGGTPGAARLKLRIVPNAKRDEVVGEYGDAVKIKIAAPALDGKANGAVLEFVAKTLRVHRRDITLIAGEKSRDKLIEIATLDASETRARLLPQPPAAGGGPGE